MPNNPPFRIGYGYDIHRLSRNRKLVLGGVELPYHLGLEGHSDADCLTHAVADAVLGSLGLPDIGHYFPPSDPVFKDMDSQKILVTAVEEIQKAGYEVINIDSVIIAEEPKIWPYITEMKTRLAESLKVGPDCVGIKATTNERLGAIGNLEGIAAQATCLVSLKS